MERTIIALAAGLFTAPQASTQDSAAPQVFGGARIQEIYRVRLDRGDLLLETILDTIRRNNIQERAVLTAGGSLSECTSHRVKSRAAKAEDQFITVKAPMEILNINGLIAAGDPPLPLPLSETRPLI